MIRKEIKVAMMTIKKREQNKVLTNQNVCGKNDVYLEFPFAKLHKKFIKEEN